MTLQSPSFKELQRAVDGMLLGVRGDYRALSFTLPVKPMPAPRACFTRDGFAYSPKVYVSWRGTCSKHLPSLEAIITDRRVAVVLDLVLPPYKTVNTPWAKGDIDNYEKALWDLVTRGGGIWKDDVQVCLALSSKRFHTVKEEPHTAVYIREML